MAWWVAVVLLVALAQDPRATPRVQVADSVVQQQIRGAILGARLRLERPECQRVLIDFRDGDGRPLLDRLEELRIPAADYLYDRVWFVDGADTPHCQRDGRTAAFTVPGHKVVRVCTARFRSSFAHELVAAEMILIHEMLHTLGLGENPPTSREITEQVRKRCGKS